MKKALVKPAKTDKHGPLFAKNDVDRLAANVINSGNFLNSKVKTMTTDYQKAEQTLDDARKTFSVKLDQFLKLETDFAAASKKASGSVRDSAQKLADGLARLEKTANFDRLERITVLLERAEKALSSLAELERDGKLDKISAILK